MHKAEAIVEQIRGLVLADPGNRLEGEVRIFDEPLVGIATADDPLFVDLKEETVVGLQHRLPGEWLAGAMSVVSYFLPFSTVVRRANYQDGIADHWQYARFQGEKFNDSVRRFLAALMEEWGGMATAPIIDESYAIDTKYNWSNWSERHVAYIAGLGTFSLNKGLITAKGMAGRFGSVITTLDLEPTERHYTELFQHCPGMVDGTCGACIKRCPAGAITVEGKTKGLCASHLINGPQAAVAREKFGHPYLACGKCQTKVPCEESIPVAGQ